MTAFIPALLVKVTLIFAAGLLVAVAMRRASSSIRHLVLLATLVCGVTLPALMLISPSWKVGVLPQSATGITAARSEEHTSELQSRRDLVCRLLLEKKKKKKKT